eukprot:TRINITY_DN4463_c0_g1_i2.p1 TRINITY_DN4463_c0_g1~~TRINITY_DN4463_c0_g1_i2.p1  ORF type:complete len:481 (+),score=129.94 TRINITY_DN4463_c0_g1_i2:1500-2942(+)
MVLHPFIGQLREPIWEQLKLLISEAKFNKNAQDNLGNTPLHYAILMKNEEAAKVLISLGGDVHLRNNEGKSSLDLARHFNCEKLFMLNDAPTFGRPLEVVCERDQEPVPRIVSALIDYLSANALRTVELFKKPGDKLFIFDMMYKIDRGENVNFKAFMTELHFHSFAQLLFKYFEMLPEPIFSYEYYQDMIRAPPQKVMKLIGLQINNKATFKKMLLFLHEVAEQASNNKMNKDELALIFSHAFFRVPEGKTDYQLMVESRKLIKILAHLIDLADVVIDARRSNMVTEQALAASSSTSLHSSTSSSSFTSPQVDVDSSSSTITTTSTSHPIITPSASESSQQPPQRAHSPEPLKSHLKAQLGLSQPSRLSTPLPSSSSSLSRPPNVFPPSLSPPPPRKESVRNNQEEEKQKKRAQEEVEIVCFLEEDYRQQIEKDREKEKEDGKGKDREYCVSPIGGVTVHPSDSVSFFLSKMDQVCSLR